MIERANLIKTKVVPLPTASDNKSILQIGAEKKRLQEDIMNDQISLKEYIDPFTGEPEKNGK